MLLQYLKMLESVSRTERKIIDHVLAEPSLKQNGLIHLLVYYPLHKEIRTLISLLNIKIDVPFFRFKISQLESRWKTLLLEDGTKQKGKSAREVKLNSKKSKQRGLTLIEGLWLVAAYPHILKDHAIDLTEATYSIECIPTLYWWNNQIHLSAISPDVHDLLCGAPLVHEELRLNKLLHHHPEL